MCYTKTCRGGRAPRGRLPDPDRDRAPSCCIICVCIYIYIYPSPYIALSPSLRLSLYLSLSLSHRGGSPKGDPIMNDLKVMSKSPSSHLRIIVGRIPLFGSPIGRLWIQLALLVWLGKVLMIPWSWVCVMMFVIVLSHAWLVGKGLDSAVPETLSWMGAMETQTIREIPYRPENSNPLNLRFRLSRTLWNPES